MMWILPRAPKMYGRHLGIPVTGLVAEMDAGFQHLAHGDLGHCWYSDGEPSAEGHGGRALIGSGGPGLGLPAATASESALVRTWTPRARVIAAGVDSPVAPGVGGGLRTDEVPGQPREW